MQRQMPRPAYTAIDVVVQGNIDIVALNRPDALNMLSPLMIDELLDYFGAAARRLDTRVIVLRGAGRLFCAGADLSDRDFEAQVLPGEVLQRMLATQQNLSEIVLRMRRCPQPIIALVHGAAAGGGFALTIAADARLVADNARFLPSFVSIGLSGAELGMSYFLPRLIGLANAAEIMMAGRPVSAERALRIGLVSQVLKPEELLPAGLALAADMLKSSPMGLRMTKDCLNLNAAAPSLEAAIAVENRTQVLCGQTEDLKEGIAAFIAKRPPVYRGR